MSTEVAAITCPTCGEVQAPSAFYAGSVECKQCKKQRSQENRAVIAQKVAVVDRLVVVLEQLIALGWRPEHLLTLDNKAALSSAGTPAEGLDRQTGANQ